MLNVFSLALIELRRENKKVTLENLIQYAKKIRNFMVKNRRKINFIIN